MRSIARAQFLDGAFPGSFDALVGPHPRVVRYLADVEAAAAPHFADVHATIRKLAAAVAAKRGSAKL